MSTISTVPPKGSALWSGPARSCLHIGPFVDIVPASVIGSCSNSGCLASLLLIKCLLVAHEFGIILLYLNV